MSNAIIDGNHKPSLIGVSSADGVTPVPVYVDPTTHRLYVTSSVSNITGLVTPGTNITITGAGTSGSPYVINSTAGGGSVTNVSVVSANGFTGTVATATSTPAIRLTTSITGVLKGNGTAISAAVAGTDYLVPSTAFTLGSIAYGGSGGQLSQNNANFFFDTNNIRLGVGTNTPRASVDFSTSVPSGGTLALENTSSIGYTAVDLYDSTGFKAVGFGLGNSGVGNPYKGNFYFGTNSSTSDLVFLPNGTEALRALGSNQTIKIATLGTELVKSTSGVLSNATAGTDYQIPITLTTTGTSGAATFIAGTLNIPQYTGGGGGGTPGGASTNIQYNSSGSFAGSSLLTFNGAKLSVQNLETTLYADMFSGADLLAQTNAAYAALGTNGGKVIWPAGTFSCTTPAAFNTVNKFINIEGQGGASTYIKWTPTSGDCITVNDGNPTGHLTHKLSGFTLMGSSTLIAAAQTNTNTSRGIVYGGTNGCVGLRTQDVNVNGFGINMNVTSNAYMLSWDNVSSSGGNGGTNGNLLLINAASNSGERNTFRACSFTDPGNSTALNAIYITSAGTASNSFSACSFDDAQVFVGASNGQTVFDSACHFENAAFGTYGQYIPILGVSSDLSTFIGVMNCEFANDGNSSGNTFQTLIKHGGQLVAIGNMLNNYGGQTVTNFVDHSLDNGLSSDMIWGIKVQGGGLTNIISGSGGVPWSQSNSSAMITNFGNSYSIGLRANSSNTNEFFSGTNVTGSFDHSGNWVFGLSGSTYKLTGLNTNGIVTTSGGTGSLSITGTTGSGSVVLATSPTLVTPTLGVATATNVIYPNNAITAVSNAATVPITSRISTVTNNSSATLTITITTSGAIDSQLLMVKVLDFVAVAQSLSWVNTENSTVTVPSTTNGSTTSFLTVGFIYNSGTSKWRCIAVA